MSIEVYQIDNLFWSNETYEFPNVLPSTFLEQDTLKLKPRMSSYYSGTIALKGGHWNWCKYKNTYFQLRKVRLLNDNEDVKKQRGQYALVRDMWANTVLTKKVRVQGDIGTGNIEKELIQNINKTFGMVEKPVEMFGVPFKKSSLTDGKSALKENLTDFKPISGTPVEKVLSRKFFDLLKGKKRRLNGFKTATKYLYPRRKDIYIFGFLTPALHPNGWKKKVVERINKAHSELLSDPKRILVKITQQAIANPPNNDLLGHFAISHSDYPIGSEDKTMVVNSLDLSKVTDIVPISWDNLKEQEPITPINDQTAVFELNETNPYTDGDRPGKLSRWFYSPLGDPKDERCYFGGVINGKPAPRLMKLWGPDMVGQKIEFKDGRRNEERSFGYFYWLDRIDFALTGYQFNLGTSHSTFKVNSSFGKLLGTGVPTYEESEARKEKPVVKYLARNFGLEGSNQGSGQGSSMNPYSVHEYRNSMLPGAAETTTTGKENIWERMTRPAPYGVLIGQLQRPGHRGERCEYLGTEKITNLNGYSGINGNRFRSKYEQQKEWGAQTAGTQLGKLCCDEYFSRFFLDLDFFSGIYFVPKVAYDSSYKDGRAGKGGYLRPDFYYDNYQISKFVSHYPKTFELGIPIAAGIRGIRHPTTGNIIQVPFTNSLYPQYSVQRTEKINDVLLKSNLDLTKVVENKDFSIEKGDFFCSSLEYTGDTGIDDIGTEDENEFKGVYEDQIVITSNTLEDFIRRPKDGPTLSKLENNGHFQDGEALCLCSNYEGGIEIRKISYFKHTHRLSESNEQIVTSVNGETQKTITYGHLKGLGIKLDTSVDNGVDQLDENSLLTYFYKSLGYKVNIERRGGGGSGTWNGMTDEQLESRDGVLLDLVGSEGYVFLRGKDQVHFICKRSNPAAYGILSSSKVEQSTIDKSKIPQKLKDASLTAKVNQVNVLFFKTEAIPIKSKFLFSGENQYETPFYVSYEGVNTEDKPVNQEFYFFKAEGEGDHIDEVLSVAREPRKIDAIADQIQLQQLRLGQNYEKERYALKQQYLGLEQKLIDVHAQRAEFDLNLEDQKRSINFALAAAGAGVAAVGFAPSLVSKGIDLVSKFAARDLSGLATSVPKGIKKVGTAALGAPIVGKYLTDQLFGQQQRDEQTRRIQEDKDISSQQLALKTIGVDMSHFESMRNKALQINSLANQQFQEGFNEASVFKEWKKKKFDEGVDPDVYMLTMIPSQKQLEYIEDYQKHYGVQCDIPNQTIFLESGMSPNVIRFRNLDEGGIDGLTDLIEREGLKMKLLAQIKIVGIEEEQESYDYLHCQLAAPVVIKDPEDQSRIKGLNEALGETKNLFDFLNELEHDKDDEEKLKKDIEKLQKLKQEIQEKADKIRELGESDPHVVNPFGENPTEIVDRFLKLTTSLLERYKEKDQLQKDHQAQLEQAKELLEKECEQSKTDLQTKIQELTQAKDKAEDERDKCREETTKAHEKERQLLNRAEQAEKQVKELEDELEEEQEKSDDYKNTLINLAAVNNKGVEFARSLGYTTAPIVHSDFKYTDEEVKQIKESTDKVVQDFTKSKVEFEKLKKQLEECKKKPQGVEGEKSMECWTYKDLLKFLHDMDGDGEKIYDRITKEPRYGFTILEFICQSILFYQFYHQTIDELEALEKDNVSFLPEGNEEVRQWLLTDEGQRRLKQTKLRFCEAGIKRFTSLRATKEELNKLLRNAKSSYYKKRNYGIQEHWVFTKYNIDAPNFGMLNKDTSLHCGFPLRAWTKQKKFGEENEVKNNASVKRIIPSFARAREFLQLRYTDYARGYRNAWDGNTIYYSFAFYDGISGGTPAVFFGSTMKFLLELSYEEICDKLHTKFLGANIFAQRPSNNPPNVWTYTGFRDKKYFLGYVIYLYAFLCIERGDNLTPITQQEFKLCCDSVSLGNLKILKEIIFGHTERYMNKSIRGITQVEYKMQWENQELKDAIEETDEEFEQLFGPDK